MIAYMVISERDNGVSHYHPYQQSVTKVRESVSDSFASDLCYKDI